uniref:glutathione gamma-glutamylcysteinyltransferase n=1 Tax=Albugo laibachii Nc14 TaxID=890382 RepID=F0WIY2_9STRA|nr:glutathione gammaglutamylcysteinyltransferase putati [Albugo laibachii Nc14]|eukprot:CCA21228.1 glutathione gammaglutamylcysteinyltransferase putati [Albugo laibachii Nc14]
MICLCKSERNHEDENRILESSYSVKETSSLNLETTVYRRVLPQDCIAFSSTQGRRLFKEAINSETNFMQIYFPLAEQFITQAEPAFCGLATLAMCLNALQIDPGRLWKGTWRWYSEELFDCCTSLSVAREKGISLSEFLCLAKCHGVQTEEYRASKALKLEEFRSLVKRCCSDSSEIMVLNYSRVVLGQTGGGHFSPIGGYHADQDMVLLLDVARFKYPPHWVKLSLIFEAMQQIDKSIGLPRGLVILKSGVGTCPSQNELIHLMDASTAKMGRAQPCCFGVAPTPPFHSSQAYIR